MYRPETVSDMHTLSHKHIDFITKAYNSAGAQMRINNRRCVCLSYAMFQILTYVNNTHYNNNLIFLHVVYIFHGQDKKQPVSKNDTRTAHKGWHEPLV